MKTQPRFGLLALVVAAALAGCGFSFSPTAQIAPTRTPAPLPSGATLLDLHTAPPQATVPVNWACPGDTIQPAKVVHQADAVVFILQTTGDRIDLVWPRGFSAWLLNGRAEVVAPSGRAVLREGDVFSDIISGVPNICEVDGVGYPPAS